MVRTDLVFLLGYNSTDCALSSHAGALGSFITPDSFTVARLHLHLQVLLN